MGPLREHKHPMMTVVSREEKSRDICHKVRGMLNILSDFILHAEFMVTPFP